MLLLLLATEATAEPVISAQLALFAVAAEPVVMHKVKPALVAELTQEMAAVTEVTVAVAALQVKLEVAAEPVGTLEMAVTVASVVQHVLKTATAVAAAAEHGMDPTLAGPAAAV